MVKFIIGIIAIVILAAGGWFYFSGGPPSSLSPVSSPEPSPTPSPTPRPSPPVLIPVQPTPTPSPTPKPSPKPAPTPTPSPTPKPSPTPTPTPSPTPSTSQEKLIEMTAQGFVPSSITISRGTTVRFTNKDTASHWPASGVHPIHQICPGFDALHSIQPGESYTFIFTTAKTCPFHDHLNPGTTGTIVVQ